MNAILGWIVFAILIITIYFYIYSNKSIPMQNEEIAEKIVLKKIKVFILSIILSILIVTILKFLFPMLFIKSQTYSSNFLMIYKANCNNLFAILLGIINFIYSNLASIFKIENSNNSFLKILFISILGYASVVLAITVAILTTIYN